MKKKILFVSPKPSSFIRRDLDVLRDEFKVKSVYYDYSSKKTFLLFMPKIILGLVWADIAFVWFASFHALAVSLLSSISKKKYILVVGGFEVANQPEFNYGMMRSSLYSWIPKFSINHASVVLSVSNFSKSETLKHTNPKKIVLVHNAIDTKKFRPGKKKKNSVITVAGAGKTSTKRKGLEFFIECANKLPDTEFIIVGDLDEPYSRKLKRESPYNIKFSRYLSEEELIKLYQNAKVYCQFSFYESFGVALAESMACGCVPVVFNRGAMPEVVGDAGVCIEYGNTEAAVRAIKIILSDNKLCQELGNKARLRVIENFGIQKRRKKILNIIESI